MRRMDKEVLIHVRGLQTMDADGFCRTYRQLHKNFPEGNGGSQERCGQCSYGF